MGNQGTDSQEEPHVAESQLLKPLLLDGDDEHSRRSRAIDWLGRSLRGRNLGGWKSSAFILGSSSFATIAYGGISYNLIVYLTVVWNQSASAAATNVTNLSGTMYFTSLIGGFVGDAYLGRLWTPLISQCIMFLGCFSLSIAAKLKTIARQIDPPPSMQTFMIVSLYVVALGNGSYQPPLTALGADQFDDPRQLGKFFNISLICGCIGQLFCSTVLIYLLDRGFWSLGFWICTAFVGLGVILLLIGAPSTRQFKAGGNPLYRISQVLLAAARKFRVRVPNDANLLYESSGDQSAIAGCRKIVHSENFRWLDKAATIEKDDFVEGEEGLANPWRLCTVTQVEEVKCLVRTFPIWVTGVFVSAVVAQTGTFFVEQGETMDRLLGSSFKFPAASMQLFSLFSSISFSIVYDISLVHLLRRITGHPKGCTSLQRYGFGAMLAIVAMVIAGCVERSRLEAEKLSGPISEANTTVQMSIFWLIPQYVVLGACVNCVAVGSMDFFYSEVGDGMRSLGSAAPFLVQALGSYVSSVVVTVVSEFTGGGGTPGWIPKNLNEGHLDYFYWLLAGMVTVDFFIFLIISHWYTYMQALEDKDTILLPSHDSILATNQL